ncbi:MAG: Spy/CpxP family protein refolding chaperone [Kiloniellaceae bacterium]
MKPLLSLLGAGAILLGASVATAETAAPYAGWQQRDIKALSAQQIDDLAAGRGLSLALAAELNGYPGLRHVLDLGSALGLTEDQRAAFEQLFQQMQAEAQRLGAAILAAEATLDHAFRSGRAGEASLRDQLAALAALQGELRYTHLRSHLAAKALLSEAQVARYHALRGYADLAVPGRSPGSDSHGGHSSSPAQP